MVLTLFVQCHISAHLHFNKTVMIEKNKTVGGMERIPFHAGDQTVTNKKTPTPHVTRVTGSKVPSRQHHWHSKKEKVTDQEHEEWKKKWEGITCTLCLGTGISIKIEKGIRTETKCPMCEKL